MKKSLSTLIIAIASAITSSNVQADDLLSVYQQALRNDPVVLKAQAQYAIVKEDITTARATLLPQLSATANYSDGERETSNPTQVDTIATNGLTYSASLSMELYHHDSWLTLNNAKKSAHQSDLTYQVAKQDLITRVAESYFALLGAKDDLEFAKAEKQAIARQLEQTKQRYSVGLTAITNVHEAQAQYDNAVTEEIRAENAIYQAEEGLRVITNAYPRNISVLNTDLFSTSTPVPNSADEWQAIAEAKNLNLIAAKVNIDIAKSQINIARAGHYPTLDFGASYSDESSESQKNSLPSADNDDINQYSVGITLNVPIYSGGSIQSSVRKAQNSFVSAGQDLSLTHRNVVRNTRNAYNTVIAGVSAIKALEQSVLSAQKALEATEAGFEVGTRTIVDVLDSTRNLFNAKRNLSTTRYAYIQNVLLLKSAAGIITEKDVAGINAGLIAAE